MNFIEAIIAEDYRSILTQLTESALLNLQTVGESKGKAQGIELLKRQNEYLKKEIKEIKVFRKFEDDKHLVIEYDILLQNTFDLPLVVILVKEGNKYSQVRTYHSVYPITEGHVFRASIFSKEIQLKEPTEVVNYFKGISKGSTEETMQTLSFEDDVYFREPAGWRWNHKTKGGLREHFNHFFADGGVPLKFHNYIFDTNEATFAGEYTCDVWGSATFKPQAGISIYDINKKTGKITGIRVYDNVDTNYV
ncbi:hypothetical protein CLV91_1727 [Maribacter vaceletii]|uniref:SnoaL-like protein n=1 Tax=Maribacter vaceletii TaxID=1206816 RepID=A0A495E945_9FLAO|nr:hypothetical protein [Maribacter vaceletii]RKR13013.1 hypothetical protein CLV91_1727 [Maribacter vaceletii]